MHKILSSNSSGLPQSTVLKTISDNNNDTSFEQKCLSFLKRTSLHGSDNDTTIKSNEKDKSKSKEKKTLKYGLRSGADIERAIHRTIKEKFLNPIEIIQSIILSAYPDMNPNDQNYSTVLSIPKQNIAVAIRDIGDNITDGEMQRLLLYLNKGKAMSAEDMKASLDLNTLSMLFRAPSAETIVIKKLVISLKNDKSSSPVDPAAPAAPVIKRKVTCELAATTSANTLAWNSKLSSQESSSGSWTWELDQIEAVPCSIKGSNVIFKITEDQIDDIVDTTSSSQITDGDSSQNKEEGTSNPPVKKLLAAGNVSIPLDALKDFSLVPSSSSSPSSIENIKFVKVPMLDSDNNEIGDVKFAYSVQRDSSLDDMARAHKKGITSLLIIIVVINHHYFIRS